MNKICVLSILILCSCTFDQAIVRRSAMRKAAGAKLWVCIRDNPLLRETCREENYAWCAENGMEKTCGIDDAWNEASNARRWHRR
jgi:hypothetical protein